MEDSSGTDNDAAAFSEDDATAFKTWWKGIKKTSNDTLTKLKQLNNKVAQKGAAYRTFGDFTGFLDAMGPFLPPPGDSAAKLLSGLCKCVHGAHMNNANLMELQDRCVDLWDLMVRPGDVLDVIESSSEAPKFPPKQTSIMRRFTAFLEEVNNYCKAYTREGVMAAAGRFFLHFQHKQRYNELVTRLRNLTNDANLELNVVNKSLLVELKTKISTGMTYVRDNDMEAYLDRLKASAFGRFIQQPHLSALWNKHFMQEQSVRWGLWWAVFPEKLEGLNAKRHRYLVNLLATAEGKSAFMRAVEERDSISVSVDKLDASFPADKPLRDSVETLLLSGQQLLASDATKLLEDEAQEKEAMDVADSILRSVGYGLEDKLMSMEAKLAPQSYFYLIDQPTLKAAWRLNFRHEQAVRWGLWWAVFPSSLPLNSAFDAATRSQLVDMLATTESRAAFKRAVSVEDSIYISIDELCRSFPDDRSLLLTTKKLVQIGRELVLEDQTLKQVALDEAAHRRELLEGKLKSMEARLAPQTYFHLIHQQDLQALWSTHFKHEQAVRWGLWWAVFPAKLEGLHAECQQELVDLLAMTKGQVAFMRAVEERDSIFVSVDKLDASFPADMPLRDSVETLLLSGQQLLASDATKLREDEAEKKRAMDVAGSILHSVEYGLEGKLEGKLKSMELRLAPQTYFHLIHQQDLQALWSTHFKHEQAVRWGLWWAIFPEKLEGLPPTRKDELVDLLASPKAQAAFKRAVEVEDSIFLSIDELRLSFPADQPLLERVKTLLQPPPPPPGGQKLAVRVRAGRAISPARLHRGAPVAPVPPQRPQSARQLPFGRHKVVHEVHGVTGPTRVPSEPFLGQRAPLAPHQRQPAYASDAHFPAPLRTQSFQGYGAAHVPDQACRGLTRHSLPTWEVPSLAWKGAHGIPVSSSQLEVGGEAKRAQQAQARGRRLSGMGLPKAVSQPVPGQLYAGLVSPQHSAPVLDYQSKAAAVLSAVTHAAVAAAAAAAAAAKDADFAAPAKIEARQAWASLTAAASSPTANRASTQQAVGPGLLRPVSGQGPHCQLPQVNTGYWGREQQTQELGELLANSYGVLLLHGPPGIGKTCLAVDVGWHMWEKGCLPGGAVLVPLKGAASARKQQQRLSEALGVHHVNDALDRIRSAGRMLLILDAAEACLLGVEVGAFVALLNTVMACHPHLVVLVTSAVPWPAGLPRLGAYMERRVLPLDEMVIKALVNARCGPGVLSAAQVQLVAAACRGSPLLARKCADACASGRATWMECVEYARRQHRRQDAEAAAEPMAAARPGTQAMWRSNAY